MVELPYTPAPGVLTLEFIVQSPYYIMAPFDKGQGEVVEVQGFMIKKTLPKGLGSI